MAASPSCDLDPDEDSVSSMGEVSPYGSFGRHTSPTPSMREMNLTDPLDALDNQMSLKRLSAYSEGARHARHNVVAEGAESIRLGLAIILYHECTEAFTGIVTLVNFVLIILDADCQAQGRPVSRSIVALNLACFLVFACELVVRIYVERCRIFRGFAGWLDIMVVFFGLVGELMEAVSFDFSLIRVFRVLRLGRLTKAIGLFNSLHELRKLMRSLAGVLRSLFWSAVLLFFAMTVWSVIAVIMVHPLMEDFSSLPAWEECPRCVRAFQSVTSGNLTFLQTIVVGDEWGLMTIPIVENHPWTMVIFGGALVTMSLGMLNLIVAILVDTAAEARAHDDKVNSDHRLETENRERAMLSTLFRTMDINRNGRISLDELRNGAVSDPDFRTRLRAMDITGEDLCELFRMMDENRSGDVEQGEFVDTMFRMKCGNQKTSMSLVKHYVVKLMSDQAEIASRVHKLHEALGAQTATIRQEIATELAHMALLPAGDAPHGEDTTSDAKSFDAIHEDALKSKLLLQYPLDLKPIVGPGLKNMQRITTKLQTLHSCTGVWRNLPHDQLLADVRAPLAKREVRLEESPSHAAAIQHHPSAECKESRDAAVQASPGHCRQIYDIVLQPPPGTRKKPGAAEAHPSQRDSQSPPEAAEPRPQAQYFCLPLATELQPPARPKAMVPASPLSLEHEAPVVQGLMAKATISPPLMRMPPPHVPASSVTEGLTRGVGISTR